MYPVANGAVFFFAWTLQQWCTNHGGANCGCFYRPGLGPEIRCLPPPHRGDLQMQYARCGATQLCSTDCACIHNVPETEPEQGDGGEERVHGGSLHTDWRCLNGMQGERA